MGVTGCGKSTVGALLARKCRVPFGDGDDFHSPVSIAKMAAGIPLEDDDRWPWLADIGAWLNGHPSGAVVACSALTRPYRDAIRQAEPSTVFVHLAAPQSALEGRVRARSQRDGHFAGARLLDSQYAALEPLRNDERGITIDVSNVPPARASEVAYGWLVSALAP
jgi:carbohydrate kinase (thermoresistant glucokinase family)